jgi:Arm DNA-binding domain
MAIRDNQRAFKDAWLKSKNVKPGEYWDAGFPGFGLRVGTTGRKTFMLAARFPGKAAGRRKIGGYPQMTLEKAHQKARDWLELIGMSIDPADHEKRLRAAEQIKRENTFEMVVQEFVADKLAGERNGTDIEREINLDLMPAWRTKAITDITADDIIAVINRKKRKVRGKTTGKKSHQRMLGGPTGARNLLSLIKRFFNWVVGRRVYGLTESPAENLTAKDLIGEDVNVSRDRTLTNDELIAFWRATDQWPIYGPAYRLLLLTALRLREAVEISKRELDPLVRQSLDNSQTEWRDIPADRSLWTIPKARMKGKDRGKKQARDHAVPMTDEIMSLLASLPKFRGPHLFSNTSGEKPISIGTKIKDELDRRMLVVLREVARERGQDPAEVELPPFVNHDLRRTVRSHLSRLKVEEVAREAVLAHARPGIKGTYDLHDYLEEKREALTLWAKRLRTIVEPPPSNVIPIRDLVTN